MERPKVLLVDDEPAILESTRMLLSEMGYDVVTLSRAEDVLETARRERPRLLLQDVRMPGLDLQALVTSLRADPATAHIPLILFSASLDLAVLAERVGATSQLEKPFKPKELADAIESAIR